MDGEKLGRIRRTAEDELSFCAKAQRRDCGCRPVGRKITVKIHALRAVLVIDASGHLKANAGLNELLYFAAD